MSYCVLADVQALNPTRTYSATTTPNTTQVQGFINDIAGEIETVLQGRGLAVPVTVPAAFLTFLKQLNAIGAAAMTERAMFPEAQGMLGGTSAGALHWKQYQDGLKFLREGTLPTGAASDSGAGNLPFSFFSENVGQETEPTDDYDWQRPAFGKNKEF